MYDQLNHHRSIPGFQRQIIWRLLALICVVGVLAACGNASVADQSEGAESADATDTTSTEVEEAETGTEVTDESTETGAGTESEETESAAEADVSAEETATESTLEEPDAYGGTETNIADTSDEATEDDETALSPQLPATVTDLNGEMVEIESVDRIVSLTGDITEILFALDLGAQVVGVDVSATYPPDELEALPKIGYQRQLDAEGIISLDPTLVIGDEAAGPPAVFDQIRAAGIPVALTSDPPTLASPLAKVRFVAEAVGIPEQGETLIEEMEADFAYSEELLARVTSPEPRVLFLYIRGNQTQMVAGSNTAADAMITAAGAINAGAEAGIADFKPLSSETIVAAQPDVFLVLDAGLESIGGIDGLLEIPGLAETPAGQEQRIASFDDLYLLGMGPRTGEVLIDLIAVFHEEVQEATAP
ncbi:MAG: Heme ABC transporter, cell surface heme and hemoprotein receptor HmuT [Chloroflexi bacterium AL-W]|nr:Heme ABC transporter, cell surface heme and hemoprotein receptor HmuT [Chloroflexi bacterium AL-N1]NOK65371.1 Heme ABC transporter, cell surface heme and hemoprotein receptor HmuT [Chloroflexi bacterium AL-N10]NOK72363.1 Heme ABC transporter, cell surface heme and hemoprotein receptor HmuT [Chloroflexi bacterium AL-N5]NOK79550.1 Heme ABC transporter, cell surface heme and hemoprotein receptor HmuT [Chloroflexi bacterium AL-W]NOK87466.1 Heme ABC transporter, cell surface heme and hemoprotein 